jgi:hypothetical protein
MTALSGGILKGFESTKSGARFCVRSFFGLLATLQQELVFQRNVRCDLWTRAARHLVLLPLCLLAWPALSRATADESAVPPTPIEFTVQTGHTAEIQGLEYAANGKFFVSA